VNSCQQVSSPWWVNAVVVATWLGALVFVCSYAWSTRGAWRDSGVGRNVMGLMAAITVVSALAVAAIIFGTDWPHRDVIRFAAWASIGFFVWGRVFILLRMRRRP
jgi:hypothetical protein